MGYENSIDAFKEWLSELIKRSAESGLPASLRDDAFVLNSFFTNKKSDAVSRSQYYRIRGRLLFLGEQFNVVDIAIPDRDVVLKHSPSDIYFKDIDELLSFIDSAVKRKFVGYNPNTDNVLIKTISMLAWYGLSEGNMVEIQKSDVRNKSITSFDFDFSLLANKEHDVLNRLALSDYYNALPSGKQIMFTGDASYLFRPTRIKLDRIPVSEIAGQIKKFNLLIQNSKQHISVKRLQKNGRFAKVLQDNSGLSDIEKIEKYFKCSRKDNKVAFAIVKDYQNWKENLNK
ncbi:MAG: hypothetical protein FWE13_01790 [Firmicutes bacterium]|nr:hypothetical protein [Bacillota bacterium]